MKLASPSF